MKTSSWVIIEKSTGKAIMETFNKAILHKINTRKYQAIPIYQYLTSLNH